MVLAVARMGREDAGRTTSGCVFHVASLNTISRISSERESSFGDPV